MPPRKHRRVYDPNSRREKYAKEQAFWSRQEQVAVAQMMVDDAPRMADDALKETCRESSPTLAAGHQWSPGSPSLFHPAFAMPWWSPTEWWWSSPARPVARAPVAAAPVARAPVTAAPAVAAPVPAAPVPAAPVAAPQLAYPAAATARAEAVAHTTFSLFNDDIWVVDVSDEVSDVAAAPVAAAPVAAAPVAAPQLAYPAAATARAEQLAYPAAATARAEQEAGWSARPLDTLPPIPAILGNVGTTWVESRFSCQWLRDNLPKNKCATCTPCARTHHAPRTHHLSDEQSHPYRTGANGTSTAQPTSISKLSRQWGTSCLQAMQTSTASASRNAFAS